MNFFSSPRGQLDQPVSPPQMGAAAPWEFSQVCQVMNNHPHKTRFDCIVHFGKILWESSIFQNPGPSELRFSTCAPHISAANGSSDVLVIFPGVLGSIFSHPESSPGLHFPVFLQNLGVQQTPCTFTESGDFLNAGPKFQKHAVTPSWVGFS